MHKNVYNSQSKLNDVYVGIGSNLGDAFGNCEEAVRKLSETIGVKDIKVSSFYRTAPQGVVNQNWFINCVVSLRTTLSPMSLLYEFMSLEASMGRVRSGRWRERIIDLDILLYGDRVLHDDDLILPHPLMHRRGFVLIPMVEIAPEVVHPLLNENMRFLLQKIGEQEVIRIGA